MKFFILIASLVAIFAVADCAVLRFKRGLTEDADRMLRQSGSIDTNNVSQLIDLVANNKAEECLARVICEISHNSRAHGESGAKFAQALLKFRQNKHSKIKQYTDAMAAGAKAKKKDECKNNYSRCTHSTSEIISVGNRILKTA